MYQEILSRPNVLPDLAHGFTFTQTEPNAAQLPAEDYVAHVASGKIPLTTPEGAASNDPDNGTDLDAERVTIASGYERLVSSGAAAFIVHHAAAECQAGDAVALSKALYGLASELGVATTGTSAANEAGERVSGLVSEVIWSAGQRAVDNFPKLHKQVMRDLGFNKSKRIRAY
jgi:hypothetical protein